MIAFNMSEDHQPECTYTQFACFESRAKERRESCEYYLNGKKQQQHTKETSTVEMRNKILLSVVNYNEHYQISLKIIKLKCAHSRSLK